MDTMGEVYTLFQKDFHGFAHASFTRNGGRSSGKFLSNNISFTVGDVRDAVCANRMAIKKRLGVQTLISAGQVHGDRIVCIESDTGDQEIPACDALITQLPDMALLIAHADCQAVLLYDPVKRAIAAVHSGWRGSVLNIVGKTVQTMQDHFQTDPEDCVAAIGPSLGPCCAEFINYKTELPAAFWKFQKKENRFDFWQITSEQLQQAGVAGSNISCCGICTSCSENFYSYRRACRQGDGVTGRNGTAIALCSAE